jgi:signal transduction histidine kinase
VAVPLLAAIGLTVPIVMQRVNQAGRAQQTVHAVAAADIMGRLTKGLQQEQLLSVGVLLGLAPQTDLNRQIGEVSLELDAARAVAGANQDLAQALDAVSGLSAMRAAVQAGTTTPDKVITAYSGISESIIYALRLLDGVDLSTPSGRDVHALDLILLLNDKGSLVGAASTDAAAAKSQWAIAQFGANYSTLAYLRSQLKIYAADRERQYVAVDNIMADNLGTTFTQDVASDPVRTLEAIPPKRMFDTTSQLIESGWAVADSITSSISASVAAEQRAELRGAWAAGGLLLLLLIVVLGLSTLVARSVARPLTRLTRSAERMAAIAEQELVMVADEDVEAASEIRLDEVDTRGQDEIGALARAFERVQRTAAGLVERQVVSRRNVAEMFGHVGRRTQNLVNRQLDLIDRLEQEEVEPGRLAELYALDHLSSRLGRSAASLIVLSGSTASDDHVRPMPLPDIVRVAIGEIEDYARVSIGVTNAVSVAPSLVGDLVLALAELAENALTFSPPHTAVSVYSEPNAHGVVISVVDHGIGLTPARMDEENSRLTRRERLDLAPTDVLGLFVVGRLARRHGLAVWLEPTRGGGVTALVGIPSQFLVVGGWLPSRQPTVFDMTDASTQPLPLALGSGPYRSADRQTGSLRGALDTLPPWNGFLAPVGDSGDYSRRGSDGDRRRATSSMSAIPRQHMPPQDRLAGGLLQRRSPGATLPGSPEVSYQRPSTIGDPRAMDPEAVRATFELFESGVARAANDEFGTGNH